MSVTTTIKNRICFLLIGYLIFSIQTAFGQETNFDLNSRSTYHNQLFFNRFLINPTFSLVGEEKSYLNILHRNQYATFEDNNQNYFVGLSHKLNENTALGLGVYSQWEGVVQEFGFNANYARAVRLGAKSKLTFGINVNYFNVGLDKNRITATANDPEILNAQNESKIAIQPGVTLSTGKFDFGLTVDDFFSYNQTTNGFATNFTDKNVRASIQYTHAFDASRGLFEDAKLKPLVQIGRNQNNSLAYIGALLLDLPKYGWLQTTIDDEHGVSMGFGVNLNKKMSIGYLLEKDIAQDDVDLGLNHEVSLAYTFKNTNASANNNVASSDDEKVDGIIRNYEEQILKLIADNNKLQDKLKTSNGTSSRKSVTEIEDPNTLAYQNSLVLDELILRQDSIEAARTAEFEHRFETMVRLLRHDVKQQTQPLRANTNSIPENNLVSSVNEFKSTRDLDPENNKKTFEKLPIKVLDREDIIGGESGYYVIANVYKTKKYLDSFMKKLKEQGLNAKKFYNKENGLYYVYLADFNYKKDAEEAFVSNLNGKYQEEKWIMEITSENSAMVSNIYED